jgi:methylglutaconyl-CoA hydratase
MNRIRVETQGAVGTIILARPDRRNALDRQAADELLAAVQDLGRAEPVRVIVLRADGKDFCAGADLLALKAMLDEPLHVHEADARALGEVFLALHTSDKPTVAIVNGRALAGGAGLATSCDMIIAHESAVFGYPEVAIGFVPAMAMALLVRCVGERTAFDLVATGRRVGAAEAERIGLISRCIPAEEFEAHTVEIIATLAKVAPLAFATTKKLLHDIRHLDITESIAAGAHANAHARLTDEFRAGVLRFTDKGSSG